MRATHVSYDKTIWPQPSVTGTLVADSKDRIGFSDYRMVSRVVFEEVIKFHHGQTNGMFGAGRHQSQVAARALVFDAHGQESLQGEYRVSFPVNRTGML